MQMIERVRRLQAYSTQINAVLANSLQQWEEQEEETKIVHYAPPMYQPAQPLHGHPVSNGM